MDEATSNVDSKSEALIQEAMGRMSGERTTIIIGHRLSTVMDADRIVVLEEGGIAEIGTHRGLLQRQGAYTQLYQNQLQAQTQVIPSQFRGYKYLKKEEKPSQSFTHPHWKERNPVDTGADHPDKWSWVCQD